MRIRNTPERYGWMAMVLHWIIAAAFIGMLALGFYMQRLPLADPGKFALYQLHKSIGVTIFLLVLVRLLWRVGNPAPALPAAMKPYERRLARLTHFALYMALIAMPLSGWTVVSTSPYNIPTMLYGTVEWPHLPWLATHPDKKLWQEWALLAHWIVALGAAVALLLHIAGALNHHFILRDNILRRMLPVRLKETNADG